MRNGRLKCAELLLDAWPAVGTVAVQHRVLKAAVAHGSGELVAKVDKWLARKSISSQGPGARIVHVSPREMFMLSLQLQPCSPDVLRYWYLKW